MAIAMTQLAQSRNLPAKIGQLVLLYPVTDTHAKSETYKTFENGPYLAAKTMEPAKGPPKTSIPVGLPLAGTPNTAHRSTALVQLSLRTRYSDPTSL